MLRYFAVLLCSLSLLCPISTSAQTPGPEKTVSIDVTGGSLQTVLNIVERQTGIEAVVREGEKPFRPINLNITDLSLAKTLQMIAICAGAVITRNEDGVYIFRQVDAVPDPPASNSPLKVMRSTSFAPRQWYTIGLTHTSADGVLSLMFWDTKNASPSMPAPIHLPDGVTQVSAIEKGGSNFLLLLATPEGYDQIKQIVKILDISPYNWTIKMECWTANVSQDQLARLPFQQSNYLDTAAVPSETTGSSIVFVTKPMECAGGSAVETLLRKLMSANRATQVNVTHKMAVPQVWSVKDMVFSEIRLRSDNSVTLGWAGRNYAEWIAKSSSRLGPKLPDLPAQLTFHRSETIALHSKSQSDKGQILFIRAEY